MGALFVMELLLQRFTLTLSQLSHRHQAHQASKALAPCRPQGFPGEDLARWFLICDDGSEFRISMNFS